MKRIINLSLLSIVFVLVLFYFSSYRIILGLAFSAYWIFFAYQELNRFNKLESNYKKQIKQLTLEQSKDAQLKSKQLDMIVSSINYPLALLDKKGQVILSNAQFKPFYLASSNEGSKLHLYSEIKQILKQTYLIEEGVTRNIFFNGTDYQVLSIPVLEDNHFNGCLLMCLDVTHIIDRERYQKRFIQDASHELKTPLSAIMGMAEILNRPDFKDKTTLNDFINQIHIEAHRMDLIIQDLLTLSKLSANQVLISLQTVNLKQQIERSIESQKQALLNKGNTIKVDIDPSITWKLDSDKFNQIIINLLSNANKYTDQGLIQVRVFIDKQNLIIEIEDSGIGIGKLDLPYIFERFYRVDGSRSRDTGGTGLGLAITKSYVLAHRGLITVNSKINEGSCFTLSFPQ
ncbi:MAG: ATP-binding protein [Erysipelotrichaceae bacterium]